jgi:radical SAM superfamily enzyme YgiQ (UPF0313 family)
MGPIRPPSEAMSILLRVTRNCPWNKCAFCHTYRDEKFSRRSVEEVKADIDSMRTIAGRLAEAMGGRDFTRLAERDLLQKAMGQDDTPEQYYRQVLFWMYHGMKSAFLQDANSLLLPAAELADIVRYLKEAFPTLERITSYARAKTVSKKSLDDMKLIREAGLTRLHFGMESGCDEVLDFVKKGVTSEEQIDAGRKAMEAGFDLSEYYMPGLGGAALWEKNARETARVINAINPTFVRIRSTVPLPGTPLGEAMANGEWTPLTEEGKVRELRLFISELDGITSRVVSDHMMNLLEEVEGLLPGDRQRMLGAMDSFLAMDTADREQFTIGRRLGQFRSVGDYRDSAELRSLRERLIAEFGSVDAGILEILKNYI